MGDDESAAWGMLVFADVWRSDHVKSISTTELMMMGRYVWVSDCRL